MDELNSLVPLFYLILAVPGSLPAVWDEFHFQVGRKSICKECGGKLGMQFSVEHFKNIKNILVASM